MPNDTRVRTGAVGGQVTDNPLTSGAVALNSDGLAAAPVIGSTQQWAIILDPDGEGGEPEVAWITAHTAAATTATIVRGREGTTARAHLRDVFWVHGPTLWDYGPILIKAGAVSDADFPHAPPDGVYALDVTNNRVYYRIGAVWKYAALT